MKIPFSVEQFLGLFGTYNNTLWPAQIVLNMLALAAIVVLIKGTRSSDLVIFTILGLLWVWMGLVYHILFFSNINPAAYLFGFLFLLQGFIFFYFGVVKRNFGLKPRTDFHGWLGFTLVAYALMIYPLLGYSLGHVYPNAPTFGVPCPTTIFTFGVLCFSVARLPWYSLIIPFLWALVGFSAAINLSIKEDLGLFLAGAVTTVLVTFFKPKLPIQQP